MHLSELSISFAFFSFFAPTKIIQLNCVAVIIWFSLLNGKEYLFSSLKSHENFWAVVK